MPTYFVGGWGHGSKQALEALPGACPCSGPLAFVQHQPTPRAADAAWRSPQPFPAATAGAVPATPAALHPIGRGAPLPPLSPACSL